MFALTATGSGRKIPLRASSSVILTRAAETFSSWSFLLFGICSVEAKGMCSAASAST